MKVKITERLLDYLASKRFYFRPHFHYGDALGKVINVVNKVEVEAYSRIPESSLSWSGQVSIGAFSYLVPGSNLEASSIGRFCSIGTGVRIMGQSHPTDRVTSSTWTYGNNIKNIILEDFGCTPIQNYKVPNESGICIGNDVWIADNVTFKRNLKVGHGAIVAANSLVTKDVPPYAIVAGNPAKIVKYRFDEESITDLMSCNWWDKSPKFLSQYDLSNVEKFKEVKEDIISEVNYTYEKFCLHDLIKDSFLNE
ncbi:CatB-related O-acetyltransferase [Paraglaciecola sp.]|uniref:CatB-related O-acetyltransferase n=1 Tax=Paraglaciecola sp. TaxID=1920173 RepID=UPI003267C00B